MCCFACHCLSRFDLALACKEEETKIMYNVAEVAGVESVKEWDFVGK